MQTNVEKVGRLALRSAFFLTNLTKLAIDPDQTGQPAKGCRDHCYENRLLKFQIDGVEIPDNDSETDSE
ncbi:hypothetical protein [Phormidesmis priestleyi]